MISKFDTYSEIMPDYCMDCPAGYSKCPQFQDRGWGFWLESLIKAPTRWHCVTLQVQAFVQS